MSEFIVKGPEVFMELRTTFDQVNQRIPSEIAKVPQIISDLLSKVNTDLIESTNELKTKLAELADVKKQVEAHKNQQNNPQSNPNSDPNTGSDPSKKLADLQRVIEDLKNKKSELENAQSSLNHLLFQAKQCEMKVSQKISESKKGMSALNQFESIANNYLSISSSRSGSSNGENGRGNSIYTKPNSELVGDTLHINNDKNYITQIDIDTALKSLNNSANQKAQKISFSEVSQSSFSILEKNGFTIQKIEPNKYSAYKEI